MNCVQLEAVRLRGSDVDEQHNYPLDPVQYSPDIRKRG